MVGPAVAEGELVRLVPGGEREQLVAEADPEDRDTSDQVAQRSLLGFERRRVAWSVREQNADESANRERGQSVRV